MPELRGNTEDVRFDFAAADRLVARFRLTAEKVENQGGLRRRLADVAETDWKGPYGDQFKGRMNTCLDDGVALAQTLRRAADMVRDLAEEAEEEQQRRTAARQWIVDNNGSNLAEKAVDWVDDKIFGEDVPPYLQPRDLTPRTVPLNSQIRADRE